MYLAHALILLGLAAFTVVVVRSPTSGGARQTGRWAVVDPEQVRGFAYVGAAALALLALTVVGVGLSRPAGSGEMLAVLGLFAYVAYVAAAFGVGWWQTRSRPRRAMDEEPPTISPPTISPPTGDESPR